jgi:5-methyltetrahydrofolate--homocysteine methyltransferase
MADNKTVFNFHESQRRPWIGAGWIPDEPYRTSYEAAVFADDADSDVTRKVRDMTDAYLRAGTQVIFTPTTRANRFMIERHQIVMNSSHCVDPAETVALLNRRAAQLCRQAVLSYTSSGAHPPPQENRHKEDVGLSATRPARPIVIGQIGPSGCLTAVEDVAPDQLVDVFAEQTAALAAGGVDGLLLSQFTDPDELRYAIRGIRRSALLPIIAAVQFDWGEDRMLTPHGLSPEEAVELLVDENVQAVGCDYSPPETALSLVTRLVRASTLPVFARTNAGSPELSGGRVVYPESPGAFAARCVDLIEAGAEIVAGGFGVTPAHIAALSRACDETH